jgi:hypothetical protein
MISPNGKLTIIECLSYYDGDLISYAKDELNRTWLIWWHDSDEGNTKHFYLLIPFDETQLELFKSNKMLCIDVVKLAQFRVVIDVDCMLREVTPIVFTDLDTSSIPDPTVYLHIKHG